MPMDIDMDQNEMPEDEALNMLISNALLLETCQTMSNRFILKQLHVPLSWRPLL